MAGLKSSSGGSGKLLSWVKQHKIRGVISEPILDEILRNVDKIGQNREETQKNLLKLFTIYPQPKKDTVDKFKKIVVHLGDTHVLASAYEAKVKFLVSLDQKHILALKDKAKDFTIVTPGELIEIQQRHLSI